MKWFRVYLCDEDTINTSTTYEDLIFAKDEVEARELASFKWKSQFVCIGVESVFSEETSQIN